MYNLKTHENLVDQFHSSSIEKKDINYIKYCKYLSDCVEDNSLKISDACMYMLQGPIYSQKWSNELNEMTYICGKLEISYSNEDSRRLYIKEWNKLKEIINDVYLKLNV